MPTGSLIAIDWGTTNRRCYLLDDTGRILAEDCDDLGIMKLSQAEYPDLIVQCRKMHGDLPIVAAGMIGSSRGWRDAPYVSTPTTCLDLASRFCDMGNRIWIVPGVSHDDGKQCDIMRGEEVQIFGALSLAGGLDDAVFCQPGTHSKWITTKSGTITGVSTTMVGELFALLKSEGTLKEMLTTPAAIGAPFRAGVLRATTLDYLPSAIFSVRAMVLLGKLAPSDASSYLSGLLIGGDVFARSTDQVLTLIADGFLCEAYLVAHDALDRPCPNVVSSREAFAAGIFHLWSML